MKWPPIVGPEITDYKLYFLVLDSGRKGLCCSMFGRLPEVRSRLHFGGRAAWATGELDTVGAALAVRSGHRLNGLALYAISGLVLQIALEIVCGRMHHRTRHPWLGHLKNAAAIESEFPSASLTTS